MKVNELIQLILDLEEKVKELQHVIDKKETFWNAMTKPSLIQFGYKKKTDKIDNKTDYKPSEIEMYDDELYEDNVKKQ